jgi:tetratricopeptide (TPR) repeat protein
MSSSIDASYSIDLFAAASPNYGQLDSLANNALKSGIDSYMRNDYSGAIRQFQRAIGLAPNSDHSVDAAHYMAQAYLKLNDTEGAIKAYKTGIRLNPFRDDTHIQLGNLYYAENRYQEAIAEYKEAVRLYPSAANYYALGQGFLGAGSYASAETQFQTVVNLEIEEPAGYYGLGLVYSRQGRYEDGIQQFAMAIQVDDQFYNAYVDMGYAYADLGMVDEAQAQVGFLERVDPLLADTLSRYIYKVDPPKIKYASSTGTFTYILTNDTPVLALDSYLANANATKTFTMVFQFDKTMERDSVENRFNWHIGRSTGSGPGQAYNYGQPIPPTEININPLPEYVHWNEETLTATVYFNIQQNATADGTIDPSHIEFRFNGKDVYGNAMDEDFDQFTGFSGVA